MAIIIIIAIVVIFVINIIINKYKYPIDPHIEQQ